ncbi:VOC family protein, partial [Serratia sp. CY39337]|uniref:VOC family protein n=1 Tax=Serratia sp. CY39337 TaxID=3383614 RepID=UPI003FA0E8BA
MAHRINGLMHVGLRCADIERAAGFYRSLGFEPRQTLALGGPVAVQFLQLGELTLELYQLPDEGLTRPANTYGIDHIALRVIVAALLLVREGCAAVAAGNARGKVRAIASAMPVLFTVF